MATFYEKCRPIVAWAPCSRRDMVKLVNSVSRSFSRGVFVFVCFLEFLELWGTLIKEELLFIYIINYKQSDIAFASSPCNFRQEVGNFFFTVRRCSYLFVYYCGCYLKTTCEKRERRYRNKNLKCGAIPLVTFLFSLFPEHIIRKTQKKNCFFFLLIEFLQEFSKPTTFQLQNT